MNVVIESEEGIPFPEFVAKYKEILKDKHGIYVVQTNLEQDMDQNGRITRGKNYQGSIVKVGRSQGTFIARISEYAAHSGGRKMSLTDQGGIRVLFIGTLPKKDAFITGKSYTVRFEKHLLDVLKERYGYIKYRSDERFRVNIRELFNIIKSLKLDKGVDEEEFVRRSERLGEGEPLMWLTKDVANPSDIKINFHKDFDIIMKKYKDQILKRFSGLTAGMLPPTEITKYFTNIQYINRPAMSDAKYMTEFLSEGEPSVQPDNRTLYGQISNPWANDERIRDNLESLSEQYSGSGKAGSVLQSQAGSPVSSPSIMSPSSMSPLNPRALPFLSAARGAQMFLKK